MGLGLPRPIPPAALCCEETVVTIAEAGRGDGTVIEAPDVYRIALAIVAFLACCYVLLWFITDLKFGRRS